MFDWNPAFMLLWGFVLCLPFTAQVSLIMEEGRFKPAPLLWFQLLSIFLLVQSLIIIPAALIMRFLWPASVWNEWLGIGILLLLSLRMLYISYRRRPLTVIKLHSGMIILLTLLSGLNVLAYTVSSQLINQPPRPLHVYLFFALPAFIFISFIMSSNGFRKAMAASRADLLSGSLALGLTILWIIRELLS
jgi:hypothetical protein